jgi:DNA-binding IclR family transcriptional regulator
MDLHREARPVVDALSQVSGHLVHLAVFDGRQAIVILSRATLLSTPLHA